MPKKGWYYDKKDRKYFNCTVYQFTSTNDPQYNPHDAHYAFIECDNRPGIQVVDASYIYFTNSY